MTPLINLCAGALPKLVLFDLDGTLIDSVPDIATATDTTLTSLGAPAAGASKVRLWVGNGAATLVQRALHDAGIDQAQHKLAMTLWRAAYTLCCTRKTQLYPGAIETLEALQTARVEMALVTNKPLQFARPILKHLGIERYFRWVVGGECVSNKKPAPDMLNDAMEEAGASAHQCVMVGDSAADIDAARAANMRVVAVSYGYSRGAPVAQLKPDLIVDDLRELIS